MLLCVSVAGPFFGHKWVTLICAFGIALYKAFLVAKNFMHLNVQKPYVVFMLVTALAIGHSSLADVVSATALPL